MAKLINKNTNKIGVLETTTNYGANENSPYEIFEEGLGAVNKIASYDTLEEMVQAGWQDYEGPDFYIIDGSGQIRSMKKDWGGDEKEFKRIGNHFKTEARAEWALKKIEALTRLRKNNFRVKDSHRCFVNTDEVYTLEEVSFVSDTYDGVEKDLDILFKGSEWSTND